MDISIIFCTAGRPAPVVCRRTGCFGCPGRSSLLRNQTGRRCAGLLMGSDVKKRTVRIPSD